MGGPTGIGQHQLLNMANCWSGGNWKLNQIVAVALPAVIG